MRSYIRVIRLLIGTSFRTAPGLTAAVLIDPLHRAAEPLMAVWLGMFVDGAVSRNSKEMATAIVAIVLSVALINGISVLAADMRITLSEKIGFAFDYEVAETTANLSGLEHHERPEYYDQLELLRQRQGALGGSMNSLINTTGTILRTIVTLIVLALVHPYLLLLALFALPGFPLALFAQRWLRQAEDDSLVPSRQARYLRQLAFDRNAGMEVRIFSLQNEISRRIADSWHDARKPVLRAERRYAQMLTVRDICYGLGFAGGMLFILWNSSRGHESVGAVVTLAYLCLQLQGAIVTPIQMLGRLGTTLRAGERILWLRQYVAEARARSAGQHLIDAPTELRSAVQLRDVSFQYPGTDNWALRRVSLSLPAGSVVAVVGENGSGKTTLVKLLTKMYQPTEGEIAVDDVDLQMIRTASWRSRLSAAFQDFARLELKLSESVGVGDVAQIENEDAVIEALHRADARQLLRQLAAGLTTQLGSSWDQGVDISVGQWQKVALGRALMRDRLLMMFLDEPTASLDAMAERQVFDRYASAAHAGKSNGMITFLISHRFSTVRMADLIIVLAGGEVQDIGTHEELTKRPGLYSSLYNMQADAYRI